MHVTGALPPVLAARAVSVVWRVQSLSNAHTEESMQLVCLIMVMKRDVCGLYSIIVVPLAVTVVPCVDKLSVLKLAIAQ